MKLRFSPTSPYVRKVLTTAHEDGIADRIEKVPTDVRGPKSDLGRDNPLGKVPALILDDGTVLFDSPVICEYLDTEHGGGRLLPKSGPERWKTLRQIGRASCRERVCQYVWISVVAVSLKKKKKKKR